MENAAKDKNSRSSILGVLNTDGKTIVPIEVNPANHALKVNDGVTGTDHGPANALRDDNFVPVLMATSSADGVTPVAVYADKNGMLLIKTT